MDINSLTREELIEIIKEHPHRIKYLKVQDDDICKVALEANYRVLCLIRRQTEELCLFAVKQSYLALAYTRVQTQKIIDEAIKQDRDAVYYVDNKIVSVEGH